MFAYKNESDTIFNSSTEKARDFEEVDRLDRETLVKLKSMRQEVNWEIEKERINFLRHFYTLVKNQNVRLSDLRDILRREEIDYLLSEDVTYPGCDIHPVPIIEFVIRTGYRDTPVLDEDGKLLLLRTTPVHHAARRRFFSWDTAVLRLFEIYDRYDVNYADEFGFTHFHAACMAGCSHVVQNFLDAGQDPNCLVTETGDSSLHLALSNCRIGMVRLLLNSGADPNLANKDGLTPLEIICQRKVDTDLVNTLIQLSSDKYKPLQVNIRGKYGWTPLHWAVFRNHKMATESLLRCGADPNFAHTDGLTPLHIICEKRCDSGLAEMLFKICDEIDQPVRIDARDKLGNTPLHLAAMYNNERVVELLLRRGADPHAVNEDGSTPLHIICMKTVNDDLIRLFLAINDERRQKVQIDARNKLGSTPLHLALEFSNEEAAEFLLDQGADPNLADAKGFTALHVICKRNYDDNLVETFFEINDNMQQVVRLEARDNKGRTPLELAVASILSHVVEVLLDRGADLSSFFFPIQSDFREIRNVTCPRGWGNFKLSLASGALVIVEILKNEGYELDRSDALTLMTFFIEYGLFRRSSDFKRNWHNEDEFANVSRKIMIIPGLSLYELIQLRPEEAAKRLTCTDYLEFACSGDLWTLPTLHHEPCAVHLCEKLSRGFFRRWALHPFKKITRYWLPLECYQMIIDNLSNEDLLHVCLAVKKQTS